MSHSGVVTEESLARAVRVFAYQKAGVGESRRNIATTRAGCSNFNRVNLGGNETNALRCGNFGGGGASLPLLPRATLS